MNEGDILTGEAKEDSKDGDGTSRASLQLPLSSRIALGLGPGNDTGDNHGHHRHDHSDCDDDEEDGGWDTDGGPRVCKPSGVSGPSEGWGQTNDLVVSGGCDKVVRVWDIQSGYAGPTSLKLMVLTLCSVANVCTSSVDIHPLSAA